MNFAMNLTEIGYFQVEGHKIPIRQTYFWDGEFRAVIAPELYGILSRNTPEEIVISEKSGVNYLQICHTDWAFDADYFCIADSEMDTFLYYYCNMKRKEKIDWKEHGF